MRKCIHDYDGCITVIFTIGVRVATSNQDLTKTREDEGRKKLQHKLGLEPAALYGTNRLASTKAN